MINTNLPKIERELLEVLNIFSGSNDLNVKHVFKQAENKVVNTITINGKIYAYGNLVSFDNDVLKERLIKRFSKLSLYKALSAFTGESFPWGSLTGIRPTKLAYNLIAETGEFENYFIDTLKVSPEKTALVKSILDVQKNYYAPSAESSDFFVFVPFCPSRCKYCSFVCADANYYKDIIDDYVNALIGEIKESLPLIKNLKSIYIGGGTPVALSNKNLDKLLSSIDSIAGKVEYTVEAGRPDCITEENLKILKAHGVNRICVNPQSLSDETLSRIGRNHTAKDVIEKFNLVKNDFVTNMDFIAGLEGEDLTSFMKGINTAISLSPDNITVHTLCVKKGADLAKETTRLTENDVAKMVDYAKEKLTESGYNPYYLYRQKYMAGNLENVGYSKLGKECIYNINTMEEISSTIACGANAISKRFFALENRIEREASPKDIKTYMSKIPEIMERKTKLFS